MEKSRSVGILNRGGQQGGQLPGVSAALILTDGPGQSLLGGNPRHSVCKEYYAEARRPHLMTLLP